MWDLSLCGFWYPRAVLEPIAMDTQGGLKFTRTHHVRSEARGTQKAHCGPQVGNASCRTLSLAISHRCPAPTSPKGASCREKAVMRFRLGGAPRPSLQVGCLCRQNRGWWDRLLPPAGFWGVSRSVPHGSMEGPRGRRRASPHPKPAGASEPSRDSRHFRGEKGKALALEDEQCCVELWSGQALAHAAT